MDWNPLCLVPAEYPWASHLLNGTQHTCLSGLGIRLCWSWASPGPAAGSGGRHSWSCGLALPPRAGGTHSSSPGTGSAARCQHLLPEPGERVTQKRHVLLSSRALWDTLASPTSLDTEGHIKKNPGIVLEETAVFAPLAWLPSGAGGAARPQIGVTQIGC